MIIHAGPSERSYERSEPLHAIDSFSAKLYWKYSLLSILLNILLGELTQLSQVNTWAMQERSALAVECR